MTKIYKIECEWDIDQEQKVFSTREKAMTHLKKLNWNELVEDTLENVMKDGYVRIKEITLD